MKGKTIGRIAVLVLAIAFVAGCATGAKGPSDADAVKALLGSWNTAMVAKNIDKIMATYAEDFAHDGYDYQGANKAALRKFVEECNQMGYFDGLEIASGNAATAIKGGVATITGIQCTNNQGTVTVGLTAKKSKAGWLITDMTIEGL
jgi:ketosteroid isomerase-like protein